ncbi:MAG: hypothetical protein R3F37_23615 [Candidatus Competibacteraceae bacterium]
MTITDEHLDVLQNIEFAITRAYRDHRDITDRQIMRALDALTDHYRAEARGHVPKQPNLGEREAHILYVG